MIIEYSFIADESGMTMQALIPQVIICSCDEKTAYYVYLNTKGEKVEVKKDLSELVSFLLRK